MTRRGELTPTDGACQNNVNSEYTEEGINAIYQLSNGDIGKYLNILQSIYLSYNRCKKSKNTPYFPNSHNSICYLTLSISRPRLDHLLKRQSVAIALAWISSLNR